MVAETKMTLEVIAVMYACGLIVSAPIIVLDARRDRVGRDGATIVALAIFLWPIAIVVMSVSWTHSFVGWLLAVGSTTDDGSDQRGDESIISRDCSRCGSYLRNGRYCPKCGRASR
jgi:hypothetical protein